MQTITHTQARAIEVITKSLDAIVPGRGKDYMDVILGVLNLEVPAQIECTHIQYTGIGNDTPVKSSEEPFDIFDNTPKVKLPSEEIKYPMEDAVEESVEESKY